MNIDGFSFFRSLAISILLQACSGTLDSSKLAAVTSNSTATPPYTCAYQSAFDTLDTCQRTTYAHCTSAWITFPNGGVAQCFTPIVGWEGCLANPATWIYTNYQACSTVVGLVTQYYGVRSVVGCSDTSVCACLGAQVTKTSTTCALGTAPCATPTPIPADSGVFDPVPPCP